MGNMPFSGALIFLLCIISMETMDLFERRRNPDYWWNLGLLPPHLQQTFPVSLYGHKPHCRQAYGLSSSQLSLCHKFFDHMPIISVGARLGINQCEKQFKYNRWNCSSGREAFGLGTFTRHGTRESSYAHAISSAGVMHALARGCKEARISECGCSKAERPRQLHRDWIWGGCGDDIDYAYGFSKAFIDAREREKSHPRRSLGLAKKLVNLHNNRVGRLMVYRLSTVACKCHGMSGSCSLRTCWNQLSPFARVGQQIHERFENAIKVKFNGHGTELRRASRHSRRITSDRLIYFEDSPNYCAVNSRLGTTSTTGRECLLIGNDKESCRHLCCNRGHHTELREVTESCFCRFHWCCAIECQTCVKHEQVHFCN